MKIAVYNRGGFNSTCHTGRMGSKSFSGSRTQFTNQEKLNILSLVEKMKLEEGLNAAQAASSLQISPSVISRWAQKKDTIQACAGQKMSTSPGYNGLLHSVEAELLGFVEEWRQKGFDMNRYTLLRKAASLIPKIRNKTEGAAKICLSWFLAKNKLTHRVTTHMAQRDPREVEAEALEFLEYIRPRLQDGSRDPNYIINMDQMPVYHAMNACTTIKKVGTKMVNMRTSTADSKRVTITATITHLGRFYPQWSFLKVSNRIAIEIIEIFTNRHAYHSYRLTRKRTGMIAKMSYPPSRPVSSTASRKRHGSPRTSCLNGLSISSSRALPTCLR